MSHLSRMLRLLAAAVLVVVGSFAVVSNAAGAETPRAETPLAGIDQRALVALCECYEGRFLEKLPSPYRHGCELSDGRINCLETTECTFLRLGDRPPFEESCERADGRYLYQDVATIGCETKEDEVLVVCDETWDECGITSTPNEQPMP